MLNRRIRALVLGVAAVGFLAVPVERGGARTGLSVSMYCTSAGYYGGYNRVDCLGTVSGGSGNYHYDWTPNELPLYQGQEYVLINCRNPPHIHTDEMFYLTVTDLNTNATGSASFLSWCGEAD